VRSDYVIREKNCNKCGGNIIFRQDEKSYCYYSCLQCGGTKELGHAKVLGYAEPVSTISKKMSIHPDGLRGFLLN